MTNQINDKQFDKNAERNLKLSKKTKELKAENDRSEILKSFVTRGKRILTSIRKNKVNFVQLYVEMSDSALNIDDKVFSKYMNQFRVDINLSPSAHSKLRTIVENESIVANLENLPGSWGTIYLLKNLTNEQIVDYINNGDIHKFSTFEDVRTQLKEDGYITTSETKVEPFYPECCDFIVNYKEDDFDDEQIEVIDTFYRVLGEQQSKLHAQGITFDEVIVDLTVFMDEEVLDEAA